MKRMERDEGANEDGESLASVVEDSQRELPGRGREMTEARTSTSGQVLGGQSREWVDAETSDKARALTEADRDALRDITGVGHEEINRALREGSIEDVERIAARANAVSRALEKLPIQEGDVLRGSHDYLTEEQIAAYEPGEIRVEDPFIHSSVDPEVADGQVFRGNVIWAFESKTGRDVSSESLIPSEREVIFDKSTRFEVLAKEEIEETGQWLIYMREM